MSLPTATSAPLSLHEEVAGRLRELIYGGELLPGAFVDEPALCERLAAKYGPHFAPTPLLKDMAEKGESFYGKYQPAKAA